MGAHQPPLLDRERQREGGPFETHRDGLKEDQTFVGEARREVINQSEGLGPGLEAQDARGCLEYRPCDLQ